jgi:hypothetical protein
MASRITWHGTGQELSQLVEAIGRNCGCGVDAAGARMRICESHNMLTEDQRTLDHLLFVRRIATRLVREELTAEPRN